MKKLSLTITVFVFALLLLSGSAVAYNLTSLQGTLNSITKAPNPGTSSVDVNNDFIGDGSDAYWNIDGSSASAASIVIELAGFMNQNTFGVFGAEGSAQLFAGVAGQGDQAFLALKDNSNGTYSVWVNNADTGVDWSSLAFGYYLSTPEKNTFYSDTALNGDKLDHMLAYQGNEIDTIQIPGLAPGVFGSNEWILAWEDLFNQGDQDFNDFVVLVESVRPAPVPEPATMLLLGSGLIGLAGFGRRKLFKK